MILSLSRKIFNLLEHYISIFLDNLLRFHRVKMGKKNKKKLEIIIYNKIMFIF